jgi:aspartyl protease family protein
MAFLSGTRQAVTLALGWALAVGCIAASIVYFDDIRVMTQSLVGTPHQTGTHASAHRQKDATDGGRKNLAGRIVELRAGSYGHYHTSAEINGRPVSVMVDTGASIVALSYQDARAAGIYVHDRDFTHRVSTANGFARVAPVTIDRISIGSITVRDVAGAVMEEGKLGTSLLGMSFLGRLQRVDMRSGMLVLQE